MYAMTGSKGYIVADMKGQYDARNIESLETTLRWPPADPQTSRQKLIEERFYPLLLRDIFQDTGIDGVTESRPGSVMVPRVSIDSITQDGKDKLLCHVWVRVNLRVPQAGDKDVYARDLRLLRNGNLVGFIDGPLVGASSSTGIFQFTVRLSYDDLHTVFTAYAFSAKGTKSDTAHRDFEFPHPIYRSQPNAFILSFGANYPTEQHVSPLRYAVADAIAFSKSIDVQFKAPGRYWGGTTVTLVDQADPADTRQGASPLSKEAIRQAVLNLTSSRNPQRWTGPSGRAGSTPGPDDIVFIFFAGHGEATNGDFHLVPDSTQQRIDKADTEVDPDEWISMKEFGSWIRSIDAGTIIVVIDACKSGSSIGETFRPIPLMSNDFAQIAYEKKLRVLVGAQPDGSAFENERLGHGRLTHALIVEGLNKKMAASNTTNGGQISFSQWLQYAVQRVPQLVQKPGDVEDDVTAVAAHTEGTGTNVQIPILYDFSDGDHDFHFGTKH